MWEQLPITWDRTASRNGKARARGKSGQRPRSVLRYGLEVESVPGVAEASLEVLSFEGELLVAG